MPTSYVRLAGEQVPGTESLSPTLSTKKVFVPASEVEVTRGEQFLERDDEMRGLSEPIPLVPETYTPGWRLQSRLYPDTLGIVLANAWGTSSTGETGATHYAVSTGNGVITDPDTGVIPTGAFMHKWTAPFGPSGVSPKTGDVVGAYKDQSVFLEAKGAATAEIGIETPEQGGAMITASGPALYADKVSDPSLTPAYETITRRPFMRGGLVIVTWLTGTATASDFGLSITNPVEMIRSMGSASKFPDVMEKAEGIILVTGSISKRSIDGDDLDALKNGTEFASKIRWASDTIIASSYTFKFWVEMSACQYASGSWDALGNKRRHGAQFGWRAARNASASVTLTLVNDVSSYT